MLDVVVVGGGIAGLSAAVRLMAAGLDVMVVEKSEQAGGNVRTMFEQGYRMERGPHTFMASVDDIFALADEVSVGAKLVGARKQSRVRFIARDGKLHEVFTGPLSFARSDLLSRQSKLELITEPFRTRKGDITDSASRFFERRFGREAARVLAGSFVSGVYAGDPEILSAPAAFPLFWKFEDRHGGMIRGGIHLMLERRRARKALGDGAPPRRKGLFTFTGGLGTLSTAACQTLAGRVRTGVGVTSIQADGETWRVEAGDDVLDARRVIVAVPPHEAAILLKPVDRAMSVELEQMPLAPLAVVHMGYRRGARSIPDAFGFLVPRDEGIRTLGILFPSRMFADRAPLGGDLLTGYIGGMKDPGALDLTDDELSGTVLSDLGNLTGSQAQPDMIKVLRYEGAIPQLTLGHLGRVKRLSDAVSTHPGLVLAGNYLRGVGLKDAVASGFEAAAKILRETTSG